MAAPERVRAFRLGIGAESRAAWAMRLTGWTVVARRVSEGGGEVDIVVSRGRIVAFVEVKARGDFRSAVEAVTPRQQARIRRGAEAFLARRPAYAGYVVRFDVVLVVPGRWPKRLPNAFGL